jgi:glycosyltransferase involved in cell wall biosynthesis
VQDARSRVGLDAFDPIIGYVGGRPWERGGRQMVELAARMKSRHPNLGVVIVGGGDGMLTLKQRSEKLGVDHMCIFTGVVSYDQVPHYINSFDIGFALDLEAKLQVTGNSNQKVRQYLACGKPVVASSGGNAFLAKENLGSIVEVADIDLIEQAVEKWISLTQEERMTYSKRAVDFAHKNLSVTKAVQDRIDFWNSQLEKSELPKLKYEGAIDA